MIQMKLIQMKRLKNKSNHKHKKLFRAFALNIFFNLTRRLRKSQAKVQKYLKHLVGANTIDKKDKYKYKYEIWNEKIWNLETVRKLCSR